MFFVPPDTLKDKKNLTEHPNLARVEKIFCATERNPICAATPIPPLNLDVLPDKTFLGQKSFRADQSKIQMGYRGDGVNRVPFQCKKNAENSEPPTRNTNGLSSFFCP